MENRSEIACILAQIRHEYEAARQGLSGLCAGTGRHSFITARMENLGRLHEELQVFAGDQAMMLIADSLEITSGKEGNAP